MLFRYLFLLASLLPTAARAAAPFRIEVPVTHDWWWNAPDTPQLTVNLTDTAARGGETLLTLEVAADTDPLHPLCTSSGTVSLAPDEARALTLSPALPGPGFYICTLRADGETVKEFHIGYEPENVVSLPDNRADLREFWDRAVAELAAVEPQYTVTERKEKSTAKRRMYHVKMLSWGGDTIQGYLAVPTSKGKHPAQVYYNGYNADVWEFDPDGRPDWVELLVCGRGQGLNKPYNRYGDWIQYRLDDPEQYYYKGAYMDTLRALDFIEQLEQVDPEHIYAEGGSQGGAFTLAAAALDPKHRLRAIAPYVPFMSDFPDYFRIVGWPANAVLPKAREIGLDEKQLYANLSYFDIKNLARWIECPVLMGVGLQDPTCPPHTNFAGFNLVDADKEFVIYPTLGHTVDYADWNARRDRFFDRHR